MLNAGLVIDKGVIFYINSTDTTWLKIISDGTKSPANGIHIIGTLKVDSTRITSWNPTTDNYATITNNDTSARPFIRVEEEATGTTDITHSEIAYLGSKYILGQGGTSGLAYYGGNGQHTKRQ